MSIQIRLFAAYREAVGAEALSIVAEPGLTVGALWDRLQAEHPSEFPDGQLRTLQRRVKQWRLLIAKSLVYACLDSPEDEHDSSNMLGASPQTPGI